MPALPPSRRPAPNPASFHVATSTTPRSPSADATLLDSFSASVAARFAAARPDASVLRLLHRDPTLPAGPPRMRPTPAGADSPDPPDPAASLSSLSALSLSQLDLIESLSQGAIPREELRTAISAGATQLADPAWYDDLLAERHAGGWCPYAGCGRAAAEPVTPTTTTTAAGMKRLRRVRLRGPSLVVATTVGGKRRPSAGRHDDDDNDDVGDAPQREEATAAAAAEAEAEELGAYCSRKCRARSEHLRQEVARRRRRRELQQQNSSSGNGGELPFEPLELLEDLEARREEVRRSTAALLARDHPPPPPPPREGGTDAASSTASTRLVRNGNGRPRVRPVDSTVPHPVSSLPPLHSPHALASPPAPAPVAAVAAEETFLSKLTIHERPTPTSTTMTVPPPPSLSDPVRDFEAPSSSSSLPSARSKRAVVRAPSMAVPAPVLPPRGIAGLPPPRIVSAPVPLDPRTGRPTAEWDNHVETGEDDEGMDPEMTEEERGWMREAVGLRAEARRRGEVE